MQRVKDIVAAGKSIDADLDDLKVEVTRKGDEVRIHAERMYEYLPLTFATLTALSELLGTRDIDDVSRYHSDGCETCDYGSCYEWTLVAKNVTAS